MNNQFDPFGHRGDFDRHDEIVHFGRHDAFHGNCSVPNVNHVSLLHGLAILDRLEIVCQEERDVENASGHNENRVGAQNDYYYHDHDDFCHFDIHD